MRRTELTQHLQHLHGTPGKREVESQLSHSQNSHSHSITRPGRQPEMLLVKIAGAVRKVAEEEEQVREIYGG